MVVTMGCGDACPVYPGKRYLDWEVPDPAGKPIDEVRAIRDDIEARVVLLADELLAYGRGGARAGPSRAWAVVARAVTSSRPFSGS